MKMLYKSSPVFKQALQPAVDGVIPGVVIVQHGVDKVGDYFDDEFLDALVRQGNEQPQGIKSRFGHPNMCKDSLGTYLGRYKNFRVEQVDGRKVVKADLHLSTTAKMSPDGDLYNYVVTMSEQEPDMFGNSIVFSASGKELEFEDQVYQGYDLVQFMASDLVDSPAATDNLFKSSKDLGVKLTQFLDENPGALELLAQSPEVIGDFFQKRYLPHLLNTKNQKAMGILQTVLKSLGAKSKNVDYTLEDGTVLTIVTDAEAPAAGDQVLMPDGNPAPDGDYMGQDGTKISVAGGVIASMEEAPAAPAEVPVEASTEQLSKQVADLSKQIESLQASINKSDVDGRIKELEAAVQYIAKSVGTAYKPPVSERSSGPATGSRSIGAKFTEKK